MKGQISRLNGRASFITLALLAGLITGGGLWMPRGVSGATLSTTSGTTTTTSPYGTTTTTTAVPSGGRPPSIVINLPTTAESYNAGPASSGLSWK